MSFVTKKYTRPLLIKEVKKLSVVHFWNFQTLTNALSPRVGSKSAKVNALTSLLGGQKKLKNMLGDQGNSPQDLVAAKNEILFTLRNY